MYVVRKINILKKEELYLDYGVTAVVLKKITGQAQNTGTHKHNHAHIFFVCK